jgi:hypothetical protein
MPQQTHNLRFEVFSFTNFLSEQTMKEGKDWKCSTSYTHVPPPRSVKAITNRSHENVVRCFGKSALNSMCLFLLGFEHPRIESLKAGLFFRKKGEDIEEAHT